MTRWPHRGEVLSQRSLGRACIWCVAIILAFALVGPFLLRVSWMFARESSAEIRFDLSRDGRQLTFSGADGELYLYRLADGRAMRLTNTPFRETSPSFCRDDRCLVFAAKGEGSSASLFELSLVSGERRQITFDLDVADNYPSYAPDGKDIVFARAHRHRPYSMGGMIWDQWDLYLVKPDGTDLRRLTHDKYHTINAPTFAPDGNSIVFAAHPFDESRIVELHLSRDRKGLAAADPEQVLGPPHGSGPAYSPDGSHIVCISDHRRPFHYDVLLIDRAGRKERSLRATAVSRYNLSPKFAPDGASVFFLSAEEWGPGNRPALGIWRVDVQGKHAHRVISHAVLAGE